MAKTKNTPSEWVKILVAALILMIILYLMLSVLLPYMYEDLVEGNFSPTKK